MRLVPKCGLGLVAIAMLAMAQTLLVLPEAEARPQYKDAFLKKYPKVQVEKAKQCNICHVGKNKKDRNEYGKALANEFLPKNKNCKDEKVITKVIEKISEKDDFAKNLKDNKPPVEIK